MSVVAARGFKAAGRHCGVKADGAPDLAVIAAEQPASAAAVFTTSTTAAPVIEMGREALADGRLRAVVAVSGCANAGVGAYGREAAGRVVERAAELLGTGAGEVLLSTTGPIGVVLPAAPVCDGLARVVPALGNSAEDGRAAAEGILTTDTVTKEAAEEADGWVIGGMAKGSGMIRPDMATMLAYLTTDALVEPEVLRAALREAVDDSFNSLNIDGCQSTNDTAAVLASGASGVEPDPEAFTLRLTRVCRDLARQMAEDAERATRVVTLRIRGASDDNDARRIGKAVADSARVRASFYKGDPNWGRLLAAAGAGGCGVLPEHVTIRYENTVVAWYGMPMAHDPEALRKRLSGDFAIDMQVGLGAGKAAILTNDLTPGYVTYDGGRV